MFKTVCVSKSSKWMPVARWNASSNTGREWRYDTINRTKMSALVFVTTTIPNQRQIHPYKVFKDLRQEIMANVATTNAHTRHVKAKRDTRRQQNAHIHTHGQPTCSLFRWAHEMDGNVLFSPISIAISIHQSGIPLRCRRCLKQTMATNGQRRGCCPHPQREGRERSGTRGGAPQR